MSEKLYYTFLPTPAGRLLAVSDGENIFGLHWEDSRRAPKIAENWQENATKFSVVKQQLEEYFAGKRQQFSFPLTFNGTEFQRKVWMALQQIPFGQTISYGQIARDINNPMAVRAVGTAVGTNPIAIVIPCHRVLATNGKIGGYAGGLDCKQQLLAVERL